MKVIVNYLNFTSRDISQLTKDILNFLSHNQNPQVFDELLSQITKHS